MVQTITVLYVDDEPALLDVCKVYLERTREFTVITAQSASEGLDLLQSHEIQAIVSDYQMPGMDGIRFLKQVRAGNKSIPFILFTGRGREEIAVEAFENGANFYLQKGGDPKSQFAELIRKVRISVDHIQAEARVAILNRLYTVLSSTNKAIIHIHNKKELLTEICRISVDAGGFAMVWAGLVNDETHLIEPVAVQGSTDGFLDAIAISIGDGPRNRGPTSTAFRDRTYNVCNDIATDERMQSVREPALKRGYRALAAFPFALDSGNAGVITFYASEPGFFTGEIIKLLTEQSGDISFALQGLDHEERRIAAEQDLKTSEYQYRCLFESLLEGYAYCRMIFDKAGRPEDFIYLEVNPAFDTIIGVKTVTGKRVTEVFPGIKEAFPELFEIYGRVAMSGTPEMFDLDFKPSGKWLHISVYSPERKHFVAIFEDITERKRADEELKRKNDELTASQDELHRQIEELIRVRKELSANESRLRRFYESGLIAVIYWNMDGVITDANDAFLRMIGYTRDDLTAGRIDWITLTPPEFRDLDEKSVRELKSTGVNRKPYEKEYLRRDGTRIPIILAGAMLDDARFNGVAFVLDISELKQTETALVTANKKLNILNSITRHDILGQIITINGFLELYHEACRGDEKVQGYFSHVMQSIKVVEHQILFTRSYQELGVKAPSWQRLHDLIATARDGFRDIQFTIDVGDLEVFADPLLEKVFFNLFDNTLRHGGHVTGIRVSSRVTDGECLVVVEDDGVGVPADEKAHIFERGVGKNTGLGLFLVWEILEITGITIRETGEPGKGARFEIAVPEGAYRFR